jgi:hypothetical protein
MNTFNPNQHIFQGFFAPKQTQIQQQIPEYITHNEVIMEISNNWMHVKDLMKKFYDGKLKEVDQLEQHWFNFLSQNKIDIRTYKNEEEFIQIFWRNS